MVLASLESHSMFHHALLDLELYPQFSSPFLALALGLSTVPSFFFRCVHPLLFYKECCALVDWLNNHLTGCEPNQVYHRSSAANTLRLSFVRDRAVSTRTSPISRQLDAHEVLDTTDVGRLTSPLQWRERRHRAFQRDERWTVSPWRRPPCVTSPTTRLATGHPSFQSGTSVGVQTDDVVPAATRAASASLAPVIIVHVTLRFGEPAIFYNFDGSFYKSCVHQSGPSRTNSCREGP